MISTRSLLTVSIAFSLLALVAALLSADWRLALAHTTAVLGFTGWLLSESGRAR